MRACRRVAAFGAAVALALTSCRSATVAPGSDGAPSDSTVVGTYAGTLPCADCRGIHTTLTLMTTSPLHTGDGTFALSEEYLGTRDGNRRFDGRGRWILLRGTPDDKDATVFQLNFVGEERRMFFRRISDEAVRLLDRDQREIAPAAATYTLRRVRDPTPRG